MTTDHSSEYVCSGSSPGTREPSVPKTPKVPGARLPVPPIRTTQRKRGKSMSRRKGQNPKLRIGSRNDGSQYFYFQYWLGSR